MIKAWDEEAWNDYEYWQTQDRKTLKRINKLLKSISRNNFDGIGKPEPLKHQYQGYWSVKIDDANRLVYKVSDGTIFIAQCRGHYAD